MIRCNPKYRYSLHRTESDRASYVNDYWAAERKRNPSGVTPHEYERPDGTPYMVEVDEETCNKVKETKNGLRSYGRAPETGGSDGWKPLT